MQAVGFHRYGGPDVLELIELPVPEAGPGDLLIEVAAAAVNPTDLLMRSGGQAKWMMGLVPPYVPGMEFAGRVRQVGANVDGFLVGQPVMGVVDARRPEGGAQAQFVRVAAESVVPVEGGADLVAAAVVPMNGLTADLALDLVHLRAGESLLVTGGAGILGGYAIELAKVAGLVVVADANPDDADLVARLGADVIVPRGPGMAAGVRARYPHGVDGAIDAARIGTDVADLVRDDGTVVGVRSTDSSGDQRVNRRYVSVLEQLTNTEALARLEALVRAGRLTPRVAELMPAGEAPAAHERTERGGLRGRVVLDLTYLVEGRVRG